MNDLNCYQLLDSGGMRKLEQVGPYRIIRPALNACWKPALPEKEWRAAQATFVRDASGHGQWQHREKLPDKWYVNWGGLTMQIKPTNFGHLGFFAEQYRNWEYFRRNCKNLEALNLFAYSGLGTIAMAAGGAKVCHLDAARGMVEWARENHAANPDTPDCIRWIVDDVSKFIARELRRNRQYNLVALDPPSFGRGSSGQVWKIEDDLPKLLTNIMQMRDQSKPFTIVLSCHTPGYTVLALERLLRDYAGNRAEYCSEELYIPESTGRLLPSGICVRCVIP